MAKHNKPRSKEANAFYIRPEGEPRKKIPVNTDTDAVRRKRALEVYEDQQNKLDDDTQDVWDE